MVVNGENNILSFVDSSNAIQEKYIMLYDNAKHNRGALVLGTTACYFEFYTDSGAIISREIIVDKKYYTSSNNTFASIFEYTSYAANALDNVVNEVIPTQTETIKLGNVNSGGPAYGYICYKYSIQYYAIILFSYGDPHFTIGTCDGTIKQYKTINS